MSDYNSNDDDLDPALRFGLYNGSRDEQGQRHGFGEAMLKNGDEYVGEYRDGKRHGSGMYKFQNGARYCDFVLIETNLINSNSFSETFAFVVHYEFQCVNNPGYFKCFFIIFISIFKLLLTIYLVCVEQKNLMQ